ncbi:MAG: response regulator [Desulfobacterales bacterium]|jgi:HD-like signal output (HDOD) protein|nr:response regulator [Desulfobacterales bacterium]
MNLPEKRSILFVDDEPNLLMGLKRSLHAYRHLWDMAFARGGAEALAFLENQPADVILTDFRMAGMTGIELLREVKERYPHVIRVIFSGEVDQSLVMKSVQIAHQFIAKPCRADHLKEKIEQTISLRHELEDDALRAIVCRIDALPSLPALYGEILAELKAPSPSIKKVGQIITSDIAMSSKILQLVNSAFFGLRHRITSPEQAALLLGLDIVKSLVLSLQIFTQFDVPKAFASLVKGLWQHSLNTGQLAKKLAENKNQSREVADQAFMAGLLHDCGKLVMLANFPQQMKAIAAQKPSTFIEFLHLEQAVFGVTHAKIGAYLMGLWGIPSPITHAISFHHAPDAANETAFSALTAVHIADYLDHCPEKAANAALAAEFLDLVYLSRIGCAELVPI